MLAIRAMRRWKDDRFAFREPVNTYIEKTANNETKEKGKKGHNVFLISFYANKHAKC
jgi:hypothetical protein